MADPRKVQLMLIVDYKATAKGERVLERLKDAIDVVLDGYDAENTTVSGVVMREEYEPWKR